MAIAQDMRKILAMTRDEAIALYYSIARTLNQIRKIEVDEKEKTLKIKEAADAKKEPLKKEYNSLHAKLTEYLKAHKLEFDKPRKQKVVGVGSFGWEKDEAKTKILAGHEEEIKAYSDKHKLNLYTWVVVPDVQAIAAACAAGHKVPGVDYTPKGDNPKISFTKVIDEQLLKQ